MSDRLRVMPAGPAVTAAAVDALSLRCFRNYRQLDLAVERCPIVLTGPNGAGKTNLLEALSLFNPGRGLRRAGLCEMDHERRLPWRIRARLSGRETLELETTRLADSDRRSIELNQTPLRTQAELADLLGIVWLTPAMDRLFVEGPATRRRFLDRLALVIYPEHGRHVGRYERAMRERSLVLRHDHPDAAWLTLLEERMAGAALAVAAARRDLVKGLNSLLARPGRFLPRVALELEGETERALLATSALAAEERLRQRLEASRELDRQSGGAAHGPHRSDLLVRDLETDEPATALSTGRQKTLLLAITLAEAELRFCVRGDLPIMLLDEVAAHLDAERRRQVCETIAGLGCQAWLTGVDAALFEPLRGRARFISVHEGQLNIHE